MIEESMERRDKRKDERTGRKDSKQCKEMNKLRKE